MIAFHPEKQGIAYKLNNLIDYLSILKQNSNVIAIIIYPIELGYQNYLNIFRKEYPTRSMIRAISITISFTIGPILIEFANFTWLEARANGLYQMIPIFNLLPEKIGTDLCCAYLCGYFFTWCTYQITNIYTQLAFDGREHYLTTSKTNEIHEKMIDNNFNITAIELQDIFKKINKQWNKDPKKNYLLEMLIALRTGDLQTILDNAYLLENQIATIQMKIEILQEYFNLNVNDNQEAGSNSTINLLNNRLLQTTVSLDMDPSDLNNDYTHSPPTTPLNEHDNYLREPQNYNFDINIPSPASILYQYSNKKLNNFRNNNPNSVIEQLQQHKQQLIANRYLEPNKVYIV